MSVKNKRKSRESFKKTKKNFKTTFGKKDYKNDTTISIKQRTKYIFRKSQKRRLKEKEEQKKIRVNIQKRR